MALNNNNVGTPKDNCHDCLVRPCVLDNVDGSTGVVTLADLLALAPTIDGVVANVIKSIELDVYLLDTPDADQVLTTACQVDVMYDGKVSGTVIGGGSQSWCDDDPESCKCKRPLDASWEATILEGTRALANVQFCVVPEGK